MKEDRRVQKTKKAITEAFFDLLKKRDFGQITINDIAEKANVNRGTIYFHYEDKLDLLNKCMEEKLTLLKEVCAPISMMSSESELKIYFRSVYQFFDDNYTFFSLMINAGGISHFQKKFKDLILNEIRKLSPANDTSYDQEFFIQVQVNALAGIVEWWIREEQPLTIETMADNTVILFMKNK